MEAEETQLTFGYYHDDRADAPLVTCATCGREFYMSHPQPTCIACRQALQREVLFPEPCIYGSREVLGTMTAFGWFGKHHCVYCCAEAESED